MAHFNFVIPSKKSELLSSGDDYYVKCISDINGLPKELKEAKRALREEGVEYILDKFDSYFSVIHYEESIDIAILYESYEDLHKATLEVNKALGFILEDLESLNDELKAKYLNILKMIVYLYTETIISLEQRLSANEDRVVNIRKGKKSSNTQDFKVKRQESLLVLNNIIQRDISQFWEPPVVEEMFLNKICAVCFQFLEKPSIKSEKPTLIEIFNIFGYLLKNYNYGCTFVLKIAQLIKTHEHMSHCLPKGIQQIVTEFKCKGLLHDLIEELTEWQIDDKHTDAQGSRFCSVMLSSLASLMPELMIPEIASLNVYLHYEPPSLRLSVLNVMVEVILNNLTSHNNTDEQNQFRDELFNMLMEHVNDTAALVRTKVFQQLARLQQENAIPLKFQIPVLELAVQHLHDKAVLPRKFAANCVTTFLSYNTYSATLSLQEVSNQLEKKREEQQKFRDEMPESIVGQLLDLQEPWDKIVDELQKLVEEIMKGTENENDETPENPEPTTFDESFKLIREHLRESKLKEAVQLTVNSFEKFAVLQKIRENMQDDFNVYMNFLHAAFFDTIKAIEEFNSRESVVTIQDLNKLNAMNKHIDFLKNCVKFLEEINNAIDLMVELLETTSVSDMQEAIQFFIAAYQFQIDRAEVGILAMLKLMRRNEQERKDAVVDAFKTIYLTTDAEDISQHSAVILNRLLKLLKTIPLTAVDDLEEIVSKWSANNILDNSVINVMWLYVTQKIKVSEEDECAAMELLRMCALGRKRIITSNLELVISIAVSRGKDNMKLLGTCGRFLAVAYEKVEVEGPKGPCRLDPDDEGFVKIIQILSESFFEPVKFYNKALLGSLEFVYKMSKKPELVCETLLNSVYARLVKMSEDGKKQKIPHYVLIRVCQMCGFIALKQLEFMDDTVYKELKRRQNLRDGQKKRKSVVGKDTSKLNASVADQSVLEGAQAEDLDAEFILNVLEKETVTGSGGLAQFSPWILAICEKPNIFTSKQLQGAAIIALMRYMLVSSKLCSQNVRLVFTIFANTKHAELKSNILIHLYDMLIRFPNIVEPWTSKVFESLNDESNDIRCSTFFILSELILKDLIRAHSYIPKMALCFVDENEQLRGMCKLFILKLSHKENNLYNALPDIFTHAVMQENISDENVHEVMKFLLELIDQSKHMDSLVDRFCSKFQLTEDNRQHRQISYCLSLIKYTEKGLRKLIDSFALYKHVLHDEQIYADFKTIMQNASKAQVGKADLKPIVTELENLINSVFSLDENGLMRPPPPVTSKSTKKPRKQTKKPAKKAKNVDESLEESMQQQQLQQTPVKRSARKRKAPVRINDSDSGSD